MASLARITRLNGHPDAFSVIIMDSYSGPMLRGPCPMPHFTAFLISQLRQKSWQPVYWSPATESISTLST